ncbi:hypothetical protein [Mesorhizobium sp. M0195]
MGSFHKDAFDGMHMAFRYAADVFEDAIVEARLLDQMVFIRQFFYGV